MWSVAAGCSRVHHFILFTSLHDKLSFLYFDSFEIYFLGRKVIPVSIYIVT